VEEVCRGGPVSIMARGALRMLIQFLENSVAEQGNEGGKRRVLT